MRIFRMTVLIIMFVLLLLTCSISYTVLAANENKTNPGEPQETLEATKPGIALALQLKSGTTIDNGTLIKLEEYRRYSELANLKLATIKLAIEKASSDYFNTFKIWLALNGVEQGEFSRWEIKRNRAVLKEQKGN